MDHLTRSGFDFVIMNDFAMNATVRGRHQKYGNHAGNGQPAENCTCKWGILLAAGLQNQRQWNEAEDSG
jgi:hypothetical protein